YKEYKPARKSEFETATLKIDLSGFKLERTNEDLFKNQFEMMNIFQLDKAIDSSMNQYRDIAGTLSKGALNDHIYYLAKDYKRSLESESMEKRDSMLPVISDSSVVRLEALNDSQLRVAYNEAISKIRRRMQNFESQKHLL